MRREFSCLDLKENNFLWVYLRHFYNWSLEVQNMKPHSFLCNGFCLAFNNTRWEVNISYRILERSVRRPLFPFPFDFFLLKIIFVSLPTVVTWKSHSALPMSLPCSSSHVFSAQVFSLFELPSLSRCVEYKQLCLSPNTGKAYYSQAVCSSRVGWLVLRQHTSFTVIINVIEGKCLQRLKNTQFEYVQTTYMVWRMERQELARCSGDTGFSKQITIPDDLSHFIHETEHLM